MNPVAGEYLEALATGDRSRAWDVVARLRDDGASPLDVMTLVVAPAQEQVGCCGRPTRGAWLRSTPRPRSVSRC